ncbi:hypothetical protein AZE42_06169 [Rhizopogon vesiculosus]|uniref:Uncharacterized protein n=1 Tax=Rhizopogon vesiculosus TaxID=180088 RepID=A0A1J8PZH3_9AGAM|nr:hypothetical protein AZE42_06169 [Rhizopogon vesiculosus]
MNNALPAATRISYDERLAEAKKYNYQAQHLGNKLQILFHQQNGTEHSAYALRYAVLDGQGYGLRTEAAEVAALNDHHLVTINPKTFAVSRAPTSQLLQVHLTKPPAVPQSSSPIDMSITITQKFVYHASSVDYCSDCPMGTREMVLAWYHQTSEVLRQCTALMRHGSEIDVVQLSRIQAIRTVMYQLLDKRTTESLSRAVSLGDICLNLSFELYNQLEERERSGVAGRPRRSSTYPPMTGPY